ncbi:hypothetical protein G6F56_014021 [Rhizopus delemar]|nr:hypothetical protein G6F56_014021 [Rhizopus delemar]
MPMPAASRSRSIRLLLPVTRAGRVIVTWPSGPSSGQLPGESDRLTGPRTAPAAARPAGAPPVASRPARREAAATHRSLRRPHRAGGLPSPGPAPAADAAAGNAAAAATACSARTTAAH